MSGSSIAHINGAEAVVDYEIGPDGKKKKLFNLEALRTVMTGAHKDHQEKKNPKGNEGEVWGAAMAASLASFVAMFASLKDEPDAQPS